MGISAQLVVFSTNYCLLWPSKILIIESLLYKLLLIFMRYTDSRKLTPETDANHKTASPQPIRRITSQTLLGPDGKLIIDHDGQEYLLRKTQAGKLLLTK